MWTRSAGRTWDRPRTGRGSMACRARDRACPSGCRSADNECGDRHRSWSRFLHKMAVASSRFCNSANRQGRYDRRVIPAIVLAAGKSTRMGHPKAALPLGEVDTFLSRIVRTFHDARIDDVIVVVGHEADVIRASLARTGVIARFVDNPD